ncbi:MAG: polysaccharide biosynthesis/export family protein, partial [Pyrinomonadaceae bacterium]
MYLRLIPLFAFLFAFSVGALAQGLPVKMPVGADNAKGYLIGPGDEITVKVLGEEQFDFVATVDSNGKIEVPFFDQPLTAKCLSEPELRKEVTKLLSKFLRSPQLNLRVTERNSRPKVTVFGEVRTPSQIDLKRRATLIEVLSAAGGVTEDAGGTLQVFRTQAPICSDGGADADWKSIAGEAPDVPSRIYSLNNLRAGHDASNPEVFPGDVVVVQKATPVYIT